MMSMSGGWFFVTVSEAISVGQTNIALPGVGSWIAVAIAQKNLPAIFEAIAAMLVVILIYDQLLFRPLVAWADRFRIDEEQSEDQPKSWALDVYRRSRLVDLMTQPFEQMMRWSYHWQPPSFGLRVRCVRKWTAACRILWYVLLALLGAYAAFASINSPMQPDLARPGHGHGTGFHHHVAGAGADPSCASLIWTPIGIYRGSAPQVSRCGPWRSFTAAFPQHCFFHWPCR